MGWRGVGFSGFWGSVVWLLGWALCVGGFCVCRLPVMVAAVVGFPGCLGCGLCDMVLVGLGWGLLGCCAGLSVCGSCRGLLRVDLQWCVWWLAHCEFCGFGAMVGFPGLFSFLWG